MSLKRAAATSRDAICSASNASSLTSRVRQTSGSLACACREANAVDHNLDVSIRPQGSQGGSVIGLWPHEVARDRFFEIVRTYSAIAFGARIPFAVHRELP